MIQFDLFQKMKIKEVCDNISRMTYSYINPDTKQPTVVPSKHYKDILDQPVEVLVNDQASKNAVIDCILHIYQTSL